MTDTRTLGSGRVVKEVDRAAILGAQGVIGDKGQINMIPLVDAVVFWFDNAQICFQSVDDNKGTWLFWNGTNWQAFESGDVFKQDVSWLCGNKLTDRSLNSLIESLKTRFCVPVGRFNQKSVVIFRDCALEVIGNTIKPYQQRFQPSDYMTLAVPVALRPSVEEDTPIWDSMLATALPDPDDQATLQELMGYTFFPAIQLECFFTLVGEAMTGKSTILDVLRDMLGKDKVTAVALADLHERFATSQLVNSLCNIDEEADYLDPKAEGKLKAITGGGTVSVEIKHKPAYTTTLRTKMVLATNEMPRINDRSNGVWSRVVLVPFDSVIPSEKRRTKKEILASLRQEYSGILKWALQGVLRVIKKGTRAAAFTQSARAKQLLAEHRRFSDPFLAWWDERVVAVEDAATEKQTLFGDYRSWCADFGYRATAHGQFGKRMRKMPGVGSKDPHKGPNLYLGVSLRGDAQG